MASSVTYTYRDSFTGTGGSSFGGGATYTANLPEESGAILGLEVAGAMHFTAPVGTSYEQILDFGVSGNDSFGEIAANDTAIIINRSTTDTLTLRFDGSGADDAFLVIPPGKHFTFQQASAMIVSASGTGACASLSAKFTSATDVVEVLAFSVSSAFS